MDGRAELPRESCGSHRTGGDWIRNRLHRTFFGGFRDYGGGGDAGCCFLYFFYRPREGDRLGRMTPEGGRRNCRLLHLGGDSNFTINLLFNTFFFSQRYPSFPSPRGQTPWV